MPVADLEEKSRRGEQARRLLNDPLLNEALDALDADIIAMWRKETDTESRESLHMAQLQVARFRAWLNLVFQDGKRATEKIEEMRTGKPKRV